MENIRCFFDTSVMKFDFLASDSIQKYNSENTDIIPISSLYVKEEFLHILAKGLISEDLISDYERFTEIWEAFESHCQDKFRFPGPDPYQVERKFSDILNKLIGATGEKFKSKYEDELPGGHDLVHLATAEAAECDKFITTDGQFENLKDIDLNLDNVSEIVIIDDETLKIDGTVSVS